MQSVTWLLLMGTLGYGVRVEAAQGKGVVTAERVNLRTRASLYDSQAFAKVNTGDSLVILEQIEVNSPSSEGPSQWLRVGVPKHIPLWISSKYSCGTWGGAPGHRPADAGGCHHSHQRSRRLGWH